MNRAVTPVLLLTGYLGSGKTTLLNRILSNKKGIKFAVIVNDIGEVNIDANLIAQGGIVGEGDDSLVPLQNGCICCTLKMDLVQQLSDLVQEQRFDYIVIEASGICEPAPIAQTITVYPQMYPNLATKGIARLDSVVTVVDALRLRDEFAGGNDLCQKQHAEDDLASLVIQQVEFCNTILLNKASEVTPHELDHIKAILRELQPKAEIITCDYCDVDLNKLVHANAFDFNKVATSARWIEAVEGDDEEEEQHEHEHEHEHEHDVNPHVWVSISKNIEEVSNIAKELSAFDPNHASEYEANADAYIAKLENLRTEMHAALDNVNNKDIITFHEAFPYFAEEFNLNIAGVIEVEPDSEPSAKEVENIISIINEKNIKALFTEPQYSSKIADTIAKETGASIYTLDPIVTGDANEDAYDDYIVKMQENLNTLKEALK